MEGNDNIIAGCQQGDIDCQAILFKKYAPIIMTICRRYEHRDFGASDILQETFILIFKNISSYDASKGHIESWMKKIAINEALKVIRKRKVIFQDIEEQHLELEEGEGDDLDSSEFSEELLLSEINNLPEGYRTIFNLFVVEGFTHKEISDYLGISKLTSRSQLSKAKKTLRKKLTEIKSNRNNNIHLTKSI